MMNGICGGILVARAGVDTAAISTSRRAPRGSQCPSTPGVVLAAETVSRFADRGIALDRGPRLGAVLMLIAAAVAAALAVPAEQKSLEEISGPGMLDWR